MLAAKDWREQKDCRKKCGGRWKDGEESERRMGQLGNAPAKMRCGSVGVGVGVGGAGSQSTFSGGGFGPVGTCCCCEFTMTGTGSASAVVLAALVESSRRPSQWRANRNMRIAQGARRSRTCRSS